MRDLRDALLSPVNLGRSRWGNAPHARVSLLSALLFAATFLTLPGVLAARWARLEVSDGWAGGTFGVLLALTFASGWLDARRDRRVGLLPRRSGRRQGRCRSDSVGCGSHFV